MFPQICLGHIGEEMEPENWEWGSPFLYTPQGLLGAPSTPWVSNFQLMFTVRIQSSGSTCKAELPR